MRKRKGEKGIRGPEDKETGGQGDKEKGRQGKVRSFLSPCPLVPLSSCLSVSLSLCLSVFSLFIPLIANAQTGEITGRVMTDDGAGMPNVTVYLNPVATDRRPTMGGSQNRTSTDEDGNFKFTGLAPRVYSVVAVSTKGYVQRPVPISERQDGG